MRAVVRVFLTLPTKSIWKSLTYKKLSMGNFFIYVQEIFPKSRDYSDEKYRSYGAFFF